MANYCAETDIEGMIGYAIDATSRPTTTQLAIMLIQADSRINAVMQKTSNITDSFGLLKVVAIQLVLKTINNMFSFAHPNDYDFVEVLITDEDKDLIKQAHSIWAAKSWEMV